MNFATIFTSLLAGFVAGAVHRTLTAGSTQRIEAKLDTLLGQKPGTIEAAAGAAEPAIDQAAAGAISGAAAKALPKT